jgi:hypothetical protein
MTMSRMLGGLALALMVTTPAGAQSDPPRVLYTAQVTVPQVEVRSGPSDRPEMYATQLLRQGDTVEVVEVRKDGWLAVKPPPGSFSYIDQRFVEKHKQDRVWVVHREAGAPVLIGSRLKNDMPTVRGPTARFGTQVVAIGESYPDPRGDTRWLPILPPPSEVRFLRADAVTRMADGVQSVGGAPAVPPAKALASGVPPPATAPVPPPAVAGSADPLWLQAQQAEQAGRLEEAARLYVELGKKVDSSDHTLAIELFNRAERLRAGSRGTGAVGSLTSRPAGGVAATPASDGRLPPLPVAPNGPAAASVAPVQLPRSPTLSPPQGQPIASGPRPTPAAPLRVGWLRPAGRCIDSRCAYLLENSQGVPLAYVVGQPGFELNAYAWQNVEVYGSMAFRNDLRANLVTATRVVPLK